MLKSVVCSIVLFFLPMVEATDSGDIKWEVVSEKRVCDSMLVVTLEVECSSISDAAGVLGKGYLPGGMRVRFCISRDDKVYEVYKLIITSKKNRQDFKNVHPLEGSGWDNIASAVVRVRKQDGRYAILVGIKLKGTSCAPEYAVTTINDFEEADREYKRKIGVPNEENIYSLGIIVANLISSTADGHISTDDLKNIIMKVVGGKEQETIMINDRSRDWKQMLRENRIVQERTIEEVSRGQKIDFTMSIGSIERMRSVWSITKQPQLEFLNLNISIVKGLYDTETEYITNKMVQGINYCFEHSQTKDFNDKYQGFARLVLLSVRTGEYKEPKVSDITSLIEHMETDGRIVRFDL